MSIAQIAMTSAALLATCTALALSLSRQADAGMTNQLSKAQSHGRVVAQSLARTGKGSVDTINDTVERTLVSSYQEATNQQTHSGLAAHMCVDAAGGTNSARYCFGAPAPTIDHD